ncbi:MAG: hypothetical protein CVV56_08120 [Tenericutes bacterium HGW-Tenericutes-1]|nr:MAG: hypothetical protein CVV56_08120 [Tenericutes bacterium HGW-Tenericutes-1]PKM95811.1 MAG: hypothetical protein CVU84_03150 [Firmicutes bacterium HGW-Firmicutes-1]
MEARRSYIKIEYQGIDITKNIENDLESFTYSDNASGVADDISITLNNDSKKWLFDWKPTKGDSIKASMLTKNWRYNKDIQELVCGKFIVDNVEFAGRPLIVNIGAISTPSSSGFMEIETYRTWKQISIKQIAETMAKNHSIGIIYDTKFNPIIKHVEQDGTSDSAFLFELCQKNGLAIKAYSNKLIIFKEEEYEAKKAVATFKETDLKSWSGKNTWTDTGYSGCQVSYSNPSNGKTLSYTFIDKTKKNGKIYKVKEAVSNLAEAQLLSKSTLRNLNKQENTLSAEVLGDLRLIASSCVNIVGLGMFDGKYYIDKATHSKSNEYSTSLEMHKVLEGY